MKIGLGEGFQLIEGSEFDTETFLAECYGHKVEVTVSQCKFSYAEGAYSCSGIISSRVDVSSKLALGGFASSCFIQEGETMENVVNQYLEKRGKKIAQTLNNWPIFKGIPY